MCCPLLQVGRLGIGICYDIRFPEMAMLYAARGVQLIVYPGGWRSCFAALRPYGPGWTVPNFATCGVRCAYQQSGSGAGSVPAT